MLEFILPWRLAHSCGMLTWGIIWADSIFFGLRRMKRTSQQKGLKVSKLTRKFHFSGITFFVRECAFMGEFISMEKMPNLFTASTSILLQRFFPQMHFVFKNIKKYKVANHFLWVLMLSREQWLRGKKACLNIFTFWTWWGTRYSPSVASDSACDRKS